MDQDRKNLIKTIGLVVVAALAVALLGRWFLGWGDSTQAAAPDPSPSASASPVGSPSDPITVKVDPTDSASPGATVEGECSSETYDPADPPAGGPSVTDVNDACAVAKKFVVVYSTHSYKESGPNEWIKKAKGLATPGLLTSYQEAFADADKSPEWKDFVEKKTQTRGRIVGAGYDPTNQGKAKRANADEVLIVVSVDRSIREAGSYWSPGNADALLGTVSRVDGTWMVSNLSE